MREIDLKKFSIRTDLVKDTIKDIKNTKGIKEEEYNQKDINISRIYIDKDNDINKKEGIYTTIYFKDITDHTNFKNVEEAFTKELKYILEQENFKTNQSILIVGLGNEKSTPDCLGVKTAKNVIITRHIKEILKHLEEGYSTTSLLIPGVMGETGIETSDILNQIIKLIQPDLVIVIDALASDSIDRVCKTIQITNTGISPGSGIGNKRKEISKEIYNIPVIAIGVPTVVDAVTIVSDTIKYMEKHFSYNLKSDNKKDKLIPSSKRNYLNNDYELNENEKSFFLGAFGNLSNKEMKSLIFDVLTPIGNNLMVTPKEVDFLIEKLITLLSQGINNSIHNIKWQIYNKKNNILELVIIWKEKI